MVAVAAPPIKLLPCQATGSTATASVRLDRDTTINPLSPDRAGYALCQLDARHTTTIYGARRRQVRVTVGRSELENAERRDALSYAGRRFRYCTTTITYRASVRYYYCIAPTI
jgi:hypothetical protein